MMASSSTALRISFTLQRVCSSRKPLFPIRILTNTLRPPSRSASLSCFSRRRDGANSASVPNTTSKKKAAKKFVGDDGDIDEDAFEALFRQLEDYLKKDELLGNDGGDDDITEEDLAKLEQELAEALEDDDLLVALGSVALMGVMNDDGDDDDDEEEGGEEEDIDIDIVNNDEDGDEVDIEEEIPVKLKNWQLRRLAYAVKDGRRNTSIKNLAADLCLDRAVVLKLLRDPPPNLVMLSATLPDKPAAPILSPMAKVVEDVPLEATATVPKPEVEVKGPIHVMQNNWFSRKTLKKVAVETLEQVYRRSKRPTNAMISSIVHVTNLPRKSVVKWFEDKRAEDGVPDQWLPHEPHAAESASAV